MREVHEAPEREKRARKESEREGGREGDAPLSGLSRAISVAIHPPTPPPTMITSWYCSGSSLSTRVIASCFHLRHTRRTHDTYTQKMETLRQPPMYDYVRVKVKVKVKGHAARRVSPRLLHDRTITIPCVTQRHTQKNGRLNNHRSSLDINDKHNLFWRFRFLLSQQGCSRIPTSSTRTTMKVKLEQPPFRVRLEVQRT